MRELERTLGLTSVVAISISAMLGSGIFVLPGLAAAQTGSSVWIAYILAGLCVLPAATAKAELATAMPTSGGSYVYLERIFGPLIGTIAGVGLWLTMLLKSAFALVGFGTYLIVLADLPLKPVALVLLGVISVLNVVGVRKVSQAQIAIVSVACVALLGLVIFGLPRVDSKNLEPVLTDGPVGLLAATGFVFVSYNGVTKVAAIAEEVKNPGRNLPLGILLSLVLVGTIYGVVAFTLAGNFPLDELGQDLRPIYSLAEKIGGTWVGYGAAVLGVVTMVSMANAGMLAASRFPFAMSREKLLPVALQNLHRKYATPVPAIILTAAAMCFAILFLDVKGMAKLASSLVITIFIAENAAVVLFRESRVQWYQPSFMVPLYPWLPALGALSGLALLFMMGLSVVLGLLMCAIPGSIIYVLYGRAQTKRRGVVSRRGKRAELLQTAFKDSPVTVEDAVVGDAAAVVALFGEERSPEMLAEIGAAVAGIEKVQVIQITELPEQIALDAVLEEPVAVRSLRRRISATAEQTIAELEFHPIVSRDVVATVHRVTSRVHCRWLVLEWQGPTRRNLLPYNPIGWLINHLESNLAFVKDEGIRYVREILVYAEPGPHDALVAETADHLASIWDAKVSLLRVVPDGAPQNKIDAEKAYLEQLDPLLTRPTEHVIVRGKDVASAIVAATPAYDLLVLGQPDQSLFAQLRGSPHQTIVQSAACSVLSLKTPRVQTHEAFARRQPKATKQRAPLLEHLLPEAVYPQLEVKSKDALFQGIAERFEAFVPEASATQILEALWERERTQNTSVGHGVALPHATLDLERSYVGIFTAREPIDYEGPDKQPVDVFFVILGPPGDRQTHLQLLSGVAGLSLKTNMLPRLREANAQQEITEIIEDSYAELEQQQAAE